MAESHVAKEQQLAPHVTATNASSTSTMEDIRKRYRIGKKIGTGRFGTVHEAVDRQTGVHVAVKTIPKDKYKCAAMSLFRKKDKAEEESTLRLLRGEAEISQAIGGKHGKGQAQGQAEGRSNVVEVLSRRRGEVTGLAPAVPTAIESSAADRGYAGYAGGKQMAHEQGAESEGEAEVESFAHRLRQFSSDDLSASSSASDAGRESDDDHDAVTAASRREAANHGISPATFAATVGYSALAFLERGAYGAARRQQQEREDEAAWMAYEIATAVAYLHSQGIIHRDIKPENVLISLPPVSSSAATAATAATVSTVASAATDARDHRISQRHSRHRASLSRDGGVSLKKRVALVSVTSTLQRSTSRRITPVASNPSLDELSGEDEHQKERQQHHHKQQQQQQRVQRQRLVLADFGLAERAKEDGTVRRGMVGSPAYISPEVAGGLTTSYPSDIWGIGICLFLTLSGGQLPFSGRDTRALLRNIRRVALPMGTAAWMGVSSEGKEVVRQLLAAKPSDRPSAREVMAMPWVVEGRNRWLQRHYGQEAIWGGEC
ncbi:unnamed protein product [Closterium sp. NIES-64]|nr:unnamed protein product [Closterium sp. NIES-64]